MSSSWRYPRRVLRFSTWSISFAYPPFGCAMRVERPKSRLAGSDQRSRRPRFSSPASRLLPKAETPYPFILLLADPRRRAAECHVHAFELGIFIKAVAAELAAETALLVTANRQFRR